MSRRSGLMSGRWKRSRACGSEPQRGNPDTRTYRRLHYRATSRLYQPNCKYPGGRGLRLLGRRPVQALDRRSLRPEAMLVATAASGPP
jgi:hypothetical protein